MRLLAPGMKERGHGKIVNVASAAGRVPIPTVGVYGGSKSALAVMANTMRLELEPFGVDVINVYPGTAATAFEVNALRENNRGGLYSFSQYSGGPPDAIADAVVAAIPGPSRELWLEREGRWLAAGALIVPALVDRRLRPLRDRAIAYGQEGKPAEDRRWRLWQVETSLACDLECIMCPWPEFRAAAGEDALMSDEVWEAIRPHLPEVAMVDFTGGGEPLKNPRLAEWLAEARAAGCNAGFLSNGMLLDEQRCHEILAADPDWVAFSLDGADKTSYESIRTGADFAVVTANIRRLTAARADGRPRVALNYVLMRENRGHWEEIVRLAGDLGVDQINFKQCDVIRGDNGRTHGLIAGLPESERQDLEKELGRVRKLSRKLGVETTAFSFAPDEQPVCDQDPTSSLFIRRDGVVAPCINQAYGGRTTFLGEPAEMPATHFGRLPGSDAGSVWEDASCRAFRELFRNRITAHDGRLIGGGLGHSLHEMKEAFREAQEAMPSPPQGCRHCHYLYDL